MGDSNVNLASLIGSRICHDLISPIGAISNGLELLDIAGAAEGPEMELISDSVGNAGARIRFFRVAYGAGGDQIMGSPDVTSLLEDMTRGGRLGVTWEPPEGQRRGEVRLAFLALQCLETAMPYGGDVRIRVEDGRWTVAGQADRVSVDADLWKMLQGAGHAEITPALVQFALLPAVAGDLGRKIGIKQAPGQIEINF